MVTDAVNPSEIDFKDLEAKYAVDETLSTDQYVLVDGLPIVPESKVEKLIKVLIKQFEKVAPLAGDESCFYMPLNESRMSQGFAFVEFKTVEGALEAIKVFNHKKLDAKHTLLMDKMATVAKYIDFADLKYKEPHVPEFKPLPHLRWWLTDPLGRDQAVMHADNGVSVSWFRKDSEPQQVLAPSRSFTDGFVRWSPLGTYLLSSHPQGVALHAGPDFEIVARFPHRDVRLVDFSPDERFLVTGSKTPIKLGGPFKEVDEGNNIVIWSVETQAALRSFPLPPSKEPNMPPPWPVFKWSSNSQFFARISQPNMLSIYESETLSLVGKKSMQVPGIAGFEFAPAEIHGKQLLALWTPEATNQTAKVCIVNAATKEIIHNRSLFNVVQVRFYWQNEAQYLCSKIDRLTKNKKAMTSSLEIYRMQEKSMPIEVLDFKETVLDFAWEPRSDRFAIISYFEAAPAPGVTVDKTVNPQRNVLSFFALEREKKLQGTWKEANRFNDSATIGLSWCPRGRFFAASTLGTGRVALNIYDVTHEHPIPAATNCALPAAADLQINVCMLKQIDHIGAQTFLWDPSGRYLVTLAAAHDGPSGGKGFHLWTATGVPLRKQQVEGLGALMWRPRPPSILSKEQRKKVTKELKTRAAEFDLEDASLAMEDSQETKRKRDSLVNEWAQFRARMRSILVNYHITPEEDLFEVHDGKVYFKRITIVEEEEEEVE